MHSVIHVNDLINFSLNNYAKIFISNNYKFIIIGNVFFECPLLMFLLLWCLLFLCSVFCFLFLFFVAFVLK